MLRHCCCVAGVCLDALRAARRAPRAAGVLRPAPPRSYTHWPSVQWTEHTVHVHDRCLRSLIHAHPAWQIADCAAISTRSSKTLINMA